MSKLQITSERLNLRLIEMSDLNMIHQLHSQPEVDEFNTLGIPDSIDETRSIIEAWISDNQRSEIRNYTFAVEKRENGDFIGLFGLKLGDKKFNRAEVWYKIHPMFWKKGFATEALELMIDFGFKTLNLHRIEAGCAVDNIGSIKVLEKVGMQKEGRRRQVLPLKYGWSDNFGFAILSTD